MRFFHVLHRIFNHVEKAVMLSDLCLKVKNSHLHQQKLLRFYSSAWETEFFHSIIIFIVILVVRVIVFLSLIHFSNLKGKQVKHNFDFPLLFFQYSVIFLSDNEDCTLPAQMMRPVQELCQAWLEVVVEIVEICPL